MRGQPQVVVGAHVEHAAPVGKRHPGALGALDRVLGLEQAFVAGGLELLLDPAFHAASEHGSPSIGSAVPVVVTVPTSLATRG